MSHADDLFPDFAIVCPGCGADVDVPPGLNALEAAWMHDSECPITPDASGWNDAA